MDLATVAARQPFSQVGGLLGEGGLWMEGPVGGTADCALCYPGNNAVEIFSWREVSTVGVAGAGAEVAMSAGFICTGHGAAEAVAMEHGHVAGVKVDVPEVSLYGNLLRLLWGDFGLNAGVQVEQMWWRWWWR